MFDDRRNFELQGITDIEAVVFAEKLPSFTIVALLPNWAYIEKENCQNDLERKLTSIFIRRILIKINNRAYFKLT